LLSLLTFLFLQLLLMQHSTSPFFRPHKKQVELKFSQLILVYIRDLMGFTRITSQRHCEYPHYSLHCSPFLINKVIHRYDRTEYNKNNRSNSQAHGKANFSPMCLNGINRLIVQMRDGWPLPAISLPKSESNSRVNKII
jgi:hypothetical protein